MGDPDEKYKRAQKFRNPIAKEINENRGAFGIKIAAPKKKYKRVKITTSNYEDFNEEDR